MSSILIVGASRGLGASLLRHYAQSSSNTIYATTRASAPPDWWDANTAVGSSDSAKPETVNTDAGKPHYAGGSGSAASDTAAASAKTGARPLSATVHWLTGVNLTDPGVGNKIVAQLPMPPKSVTAAMAAAAVAEGTGRGVEAEEVEEDVETAADTDIKGDTGKKKQKKDADVPGGPTDPVVDLVILSAGFFGREAFGEPHWDAEMRMYTISAVAPVFIIRALVKSGVLSASCPPENAASGTVAKIILVSSEAGSLTLRHASEGGGNYGHHASKAATNMVGRLLSLDLAERRIAVGMVHPGFMRTEMTRSVGFDRFWDSGHG